MLNKSGKATSRYKSFEYMMHPKSVAIVGASNNPDKVGHIILQNYLDVGYSGKLYPININADQPILGLKAYKSVTSVHAPIDMAVIAVPAAVVPQVLDDCGKAGVKSTIIVSGGFSEVGETALQDQCGALAKKYGFSILGPNCLGVMDPKSRIDTLFLPTFKLDPPKIGGVSFASQSGAVGSSVLDMMANEGFGLAKFISYGNAIDLDEADILDYLAKDKDTKVILFYIEGVKRGREFMAVAKKATKIKPVIVIKGGTTAAGAGAAHSHTASLAGSNEAYEAAFKQCGIIQAKNIGEVIDFAKIFDTQPLPTGNRVAIITNGGGTGVLATDAVYECGLTVPALSEDSIKELKKAMPPIVNVRLPLDMAGDADDARFGAALKAMNDDPNVDMILTIALFQTPGADSRVAATLIHYGTSMKKPLVVVSPGGTYTQAHRKMMESSGIPVYSSPEQATGALAALLRYSKYKLRK